MFLVVFFAGLSPAARADANITVDGNLTEWPAGAFTFYDSSGDMPPPYADITRIRATNNNTSGNNGSLFLAIDYLTNFRPHVGSNDVDVYIYLDIDGDGIISGSIDRIIEVTEGAVTDGAGNSVGSIGAMAFQGMTMEVSIPYSVLGLSHGADAFGIATMTSGHPGGNTDRSPEAGQGNNGFITYDGTQGDGIEPLAVRLLSLSAFPTASGVEIAWTTGSERANAGFHVYRLDNIGNERRLTPRLIPGRVDAGLGGSYRFQDPDGRIGDIYLVEDLETSGRSRRRAVLVGSRVDAAATPAADPTPTRRPRPAPRVRQPARGFHPEVKLAVREPGILQLTLDTLSASGLDPAEVSARGLSLQRAEGAVPLLQDGATFLFVGTPLRDRYADFEVVRARADAGAAMDTRPVQPLCTRAIRSLEHQHTVSEDHVYYVASPSSDPFFWALAFDGLPAEAGFDVPAPLPGAAELNVRLAGTAASHAASLWLNGAFLGKRSWTGSGMAELSLPVPEDVLLPAGNRLRLEIPAGAVDVLFLDSLTVRYPRRLTAIGGVLEVTSTAGRCLEFSGFSSPDVLVLDVTDPHQPVRLTNAGVNPRSPGYAVRFQDSHAPGGTPRRYLVVERAAAKIPSPLGPVAPITPQAAGILIIAPPEFQDAAARLAVLRQPLAPRVVSPEGIFDALSFSRPSPEAIKSFLQATRALDAPALKHVVLLGGATVDSNNVLGTSAPDWIPAPFWVTSGHGYEAASDGWYVTGEDGAPWAAIGRLAVQSPGEAASVIDKLAVHPAGASFGENLLVADADEVTPRERYSFAKAAAGLAALMPVTTAVTLLRVDEHPDPAAALRAALEAGVDTVHFFGHAYLEGWSSPAILTSPGAGALNNPLPFLAFSWSCFDGAFTGPWGDALAWALVRHPTAGAIASVAGSSLTQPASVQLFAREVQRALTAGIPTLGEAVRQAKARLAGLQPALDDTLATFNLLGDPATPNPWAR